MVLLVGVLVNKFQSSQKSVRTLLHVDDTPQTEVSLELIRVTDEKYVIRSNAPVTLVPLVGWDKRWEDRVVPLLPPLLYESL